MSKIAVILALPAEYNTSSMLRCRSIINAITGMGHFVKCYMPNPDKNSKYYSESLNISCTEIFRYGKVIQNGAILAETQKKNKSIKAHIKSIIYKLFKKVDVFGATLLYLPERKRISKNISKGEFDILISFSDPMPAHMIGKYCKKHNKNLRYIQQWGDPLASDTISKIAQPVWMRKIIEKSLLKPADRICYVSPFTNDEQKKLFPSQANKMLFLPTPCLEYKDEGESTNTDQICLGYFGSYNSVARNLIPFYNAIKTIPDVKCLIIGDSDIELQETDNIKIIARVSQEELSEYMKQINVIVCLMNHKGNQIPGKVYHDASSSKDILFLKDGEYGDDIERFFSKYNHYTFVNNNEKSIAMAIEKYKQFGVPHREAVKEFTAENIVCELIAE